jgi:hypothetical protein
MTWSDDDACRRRRQSPSAGDEGDEGGTYLGFPLSSPRPLHLVVIPHPPRVDRVVLVDVGLAPALMLPLSLLPVVLLMVVLLMVVVRWWWWFGRQGCWWP